MTVRVWLIAMFAWMIAFGGGAQAAPPPKVRIVATSFVLPAKFETLKAWAAEEGLELDYRYVDRGKPDPALVEGTDLILLDGPRPNDMAALQKVTTDNLSGKAWLAVGGGPPKWEGLSAPDAAKLAGYYAAGGEANFRIFLKALKRRLSGQSLADLPAAPRRAASGLYHPQAGVLVDAGAFLSWRGADRPTVVLAISDGVIADMQTAVVDAVIRDAETRGLSAVAFWYDERDPQALTRVVRPLKAVALVNMTHMQNGPARQAEFADLDITVLQVMGYRAGTIAEWRAEASGVGFSSVPTQFAVPESWGLSDPVLISAVENGAQVPIPEQVALLGAKLRRLAALRSRPNAEKRVALMFWNSPAGEKNFSASHLNVPRSVEAITAALHAAGYTVPPTTEATLITAAQLMMGGYYRPETLDGLARQGFAACLPVSAYKAWLGTLPPVTRTELLDRHGAPERHWAVRGSGASACFIIPRVRIGNMTFLPQPPRAGKVGAATHDTKSVPDHIYLAAYVILREQEKIDALVHFGTHGTQEWTPGKDRGLWAYDYPNLAVGDMPVIYPYIQDNVAEAIQAKRRGRAVTISHQTPPFAPSGLYDELRDLHGLIHEYSQLEPGGVRDRVQDNLLNTAVAANLHKDIGWTEAAARADFPGFYAVLHDHLHELARAAVPLGLHTFGQSATVEHRLMTVMQALGKPYLSALGLDPNEAFAEDFSAIQTGEPYRVLKAHLIDGQAVDDLNPALKAEIEKGRAQFERLSVTGEMEALLAALDARFVRPATGGDPVRDPMLVSGRNLYAFDAAKIPTKAAYDQSEAAYKGLIDAYQAKHRRLPRKLVFSLWSGESIRTLGVMEGQVLRAYGLDPVWDASGRVINLTIRPDSDLSAPRVDAVLQITSVYRDQFDNFMTLLARAINKLAAQGGNPVATNSAELEAQLIAKGIAPDRAKALARLRMFSNAPGEYGSGLPDRVIDSKSWETEGELAEDFLARLQYGYGSDGWGTSEDGANLLAENLKTVDAAVLSRSSSLHGLLSTDHPFEYLGGLSLAVRHLSGKSPELFITDTRSGEVRTTTPAAFLSAELRTRYLNPEWIRQMQTEGYAGANEMLAVTQNLFGWQVTDPASVRPDQWQAMTDTYVRDSRNLGLNDWFEKNHPSAQKQMVDQMLEAVRKGYWKPDAETVSVLENRRQQLERVSAAASGFGRLMSGPPAATAAAPSDPAVAEPGTPPNPTVRGRVLKPEAQRPSAPQSPPGFPFLAGLCGLLLMLAGALHQWRASRSPLEP
ncbi:cobaltochelatase subunit CobN [Asticcacaulis sp. SL142]|uniref:cobaltochelatase subunit CobN n=1 Tax=Asticcacaulis sp. SL142 TaxID=2995155 RepID=UPI00226C915C|nr:cobaltochelatase subunit CobN [Asticcacaulis sp. SL142]WAC48249.1 cobaltochelatase subunit CobN [Asticcacaulis sp. SL142]